ncbi:MAG: OsmC family protein [Desulfobacterales bacterium]
MSNQVQVNVRQIGSSASEGTAREHKAIMDRPEAKGGENHGAMGGEHLLMALGGCFMSNLLAAVQGREAEVSNVNLNISGTLESAPPHFSAIEMKVSADHNDKEQMEKLITVAERGCIVANTLKNSVMLSIRLA